MRYKPPSNILATINANIVKIEDAIAKSITNALNKAATIPKSKLEVERLVYFFCELDTLQNDLNAILEPAGITVTISGVFSHGSPVVKSFPTVFSKACELADLAILATYGKPLKIRNRNCLGNAILVQAKDDYDTTPHREQRELYEKASSFNYTKTPSSALNGQRRRIKAAKEALWHWSFQAGSHTTGPWNTDGILSRPLVPPVRIPFQQVLSNLFLGNYGRGFDTSPAAKGGKSWGWSRIIFDLVTLYAIEDLTKTNCVFTPCKKAESALTVIQGIPGVPKTYLLKCSINKVFRRLEDPFPLRTKEGELPSKNWDSIAKLADEFKWEQFEVELSQVLNRAKKKNIAGKDDPKNGGDDPPEQPLDTGPPNGGSFIIFDFCEIPSNSGPHVKC